jgi:hypothetical protein
MPHLKFKPTHCSNCGIRLLFSYHYCPQCGQVRHNLNLPLKHLIEEAIEGIFHFDTKFVQTVTAMCFKPGFITSEFIKGKQIRYVAPVRFYVFITFIFFLLISLPQEKHAASPDVESKPAFIITFYGVSSTEVRSDMQLSQLDSVMQSHALRPTMINRYIVHQLSRLGKDGQEGFIHLFVKGTSYMMFALMPMFALVIFLLYRKKAGQYIGTLIFSVHFHSFIFLLLIFSFLVDKAAGTPIFFILTIVLSPIYLFMALRRVYNDSFKRTLLKTLIIGASQLVCIGLLFWITAMIVVLIL